MKPALFLAGMATCLLHPCGPARAAESDVTPALVCSVQSAIRHKSPAWPAEKCARVAAALNVTSAPRTILAIAINESDLRERATAWHGETVVDAGLVGLRCLLDHGRCTNGVVKGYRVADLQSAETSIRLANVLLVSLGGDVQGWNRASKGYSARVRAIESALDGRRVSTKSRRVNDLVGKILAASKPNS